MIRLAQDADSSAVARLIRDVFAEYEGIVFDLAELPELRSIRSHFDHKQGRFWVWQDDGGEVVGCVGISTIAPATSELHKLYVKKSARRRGIGTALCELVEKEACLRATQRIELWTDVKFTDAHSFYERRGYVRSPERRALKDRSDTHEYHYVRQLR